MTCSISENDDQSPALADDQAATTAAAAHRPVGRRACGWAVMVAAAGLLAAAVFFLVLAPLLQPDVDPRIGRLAVTSNLSADETDTARRGSITDQLFVEPQTPWEHPLDPALAVAETGLEKMRAEVQDYTALMVKQERVGDTLMEEEWIRIKVRHARPEQSPPVAKSFYLRFEKPRSKIGQEVIWVEGRDDGKLVAHAGGLSNLMTVRLTPTGFIAMRGNRYPITELGIETLVVRMLEKGARDRAWEECEVRVDRETEIDGRPCTVITITHPRQREHFEFYQAKIYIDDELNLPVGYEGFLWPEQAGGPPQLLERYFYRNLEINVGLSDADFDPENPNYHFP